VFRLHKCHEETKEKKFELEISWICPESGMVHQMLPKEFQKELEAKSLEALQKEAMGEAQA
jgi:20S proteasome subunit alpha 7